MKKSMKIGKIIAYSLLCAIFLSVVIYAASPSVRGFINMLFLKNDSIARLDKVPDGYIGIYTPDDLNNVRNNLYGRYILMNDIMITDDYYEKGGIFEGGFEPIGNSKTDIFYGIFNGNGYVISGLRINTSHPYAGLFGNVRRLYSYEMHEVTTETGETITPITNRQIGGGIIKNLGLTDAVINVESAMIKPHCYIGAIAGYADYIVGCYTKNVTIIVDCSENKHVNSETCAIGGIVGRSYFVDSCYSDVGITVTNLSDGIENVYISGIAGYTYSCVTSYFNGTIECAPYDDCGVSFCKMYDVPIILSETVMNEICDRLDVIAVENGEVLSDIGNTSRSWNSMKFHAFYCSEKNINVDLSTQNFYTAEIEEVSYLLDPNLKDREYMELYKIIAIAFPAGDFTDFCRDNHLKSGYYYCYDLRNDPDCTFDGFDSDIIWNCDSDTPTLKLFE